jgi:hypothetical protein
VITSTATGHSISSVDGEYDIAIAVDDPYKPADYNFTFASREREDRLPLGGPNLVTRVSYDEIECYVHHGPNVTVTAQAADGPLTLHSTVKVLRESVVGMVGPLGGPLPDRSRFADLNDSNVAKVVLYAVGSLALCLIPGWGWIAAAALTVGELVYAYHTERASSVTRSPPLGWPRWASWGSRGRRGTCWGCCGSATPR